MCVEKVHNTYIRPAKDSLQYDAKITAHMMLTWKEKGNTHNILIPDKRPSLR
jgi:hypothetical protein